MTSKTIESYHEEIKKFFGEKIKAKAKETKFVERKSKIDGEIFLLSLIGAVYKYGKIRLDDLALNGQEIKPEMEISGQAFKERFNGEAKEFLKEMFSLAMQLSIPEREQIVPILSVFSAVYILDSTVVSLPEEMKEIYQGCGGAASTAAMKIFLIMDWLSGQFQTIEIGQGRKADQDMGKQFVDGKKSQSLWLFDSGFWDLKFLVAIAVHSYFLCRLNAQVGLQVLDKQGQIVRLDLDELLNKIPKETCEFNVKVGIQDQLDSRLILIPLPQELIQQRRRRAKENARRHGKTLSRQTLNRLDWNLFVTNATLDSLPTTVIATVYRVRWQVELTFKLAKSDACLDKTDATNPLRVECEIYAKLIAVQLFSFINTILHIKETRFLSMRKIWRAFKHKVDCWINIIHARLPLSFLESLFDFILPFALSSPKKKFPLTLDLLSLASIDPKLCILSDPLEFLYASDISRLAH